MREVAISVATSTDTSHLDMFGQQASHEQLVAVRHPEVQTQTLIVGKLESRADNRLTHPLAVLLTSRYVVKLQLACEELVDTLGDFVAARADGRTNTRVDVGRPTAEVFGHCLYASHDDTAC